MTPDEYQQAAARTICPQDQVPRRLICGFRGTVDGSVPDTDGVMFTHAVNGIAGESGELSGLVEKTVWYSQPFDRTNAIEELGDLLWYVAEACTALGMTMEEVMNGNIRKLRSRYPEKYQDNLALESNRDREAERAILEAPKLTPPSRADEQRDRAEDDGPWANCDLT